MKDCGRLPDAPHEIPQMHACLQGISCAFAGRVLECIGCIAIPCIDGHSQGGGAAEADPATIGNVPHSIAKASTATPRRRIKNPNIASNIRPGESVFKDEPRA